MPAEGRKWVIYPPAKRGCMQHLPPYEVPPDGLADSLNVCLSDKGFMRLRPGYAQINAETVASRPMGAQFFKTFAGAAQTVVGHKTGWEKLNGTAWDDISGAALSGGNSDFVRFVTFAAGTTNWLVGVNNVNSPKKWDGAAATYVDATATDVDACRDITVVANRLVIFNVLDNGNRKPDMFVWSDPNNVDSLDTANDARMPEIGDEIIAGRALNRTSFVIYGNKAQALGTAYQGNAPFSVDVVAYNRPPASTAALVRIGAEHYFMADDGSFWRFNGIRMQQIGIGVTRFVEDNLDSANLGMIHGAPIIGNNSRVIWFFPYQGTVNRGVLYDIRHDAWFPLQFTHEITCSAEWDTEALTSFDSLTGDMGSLTGTYGSLTSNQISTILAGQSSGLIHRAGLHLETDNGTAVASAKWDTGLAPHAGLDNRLRPDWIESYFKKQATTLSCDVSLLYSQELGSDDPTADDATSQQLTESGPYLSKPTTDLAVQFAGCRHSFTSPAQSFEFKGAVLFYSQKGKAVSK